MPYAILPFGGKLKSKMTDSRLYLAHLLITVLPIEHYPDYKIRPVVFILSENVPMTSESQKDYHAHYLFLVL